MYVVRRAFRNYNQMMVPGSEIEPGTVKLFKTRLRDRVIIEVNEHDFDKWNAYFIEKFGTPIKRLETKEVAVEEAEAEANAEEPKVEAKVEEPKVEAKAEEPKVEARAKTVAKVVVK